MPCSKRSQGHIISLIVHLYKNIRFHNSWFIIIPLLIWSFEQAIVKSSTFSRSSSLLWGLCGTFLFVISLWLHETGHIISSRILRVDLQKRVLFQFGAVQVNDFLTKPTSRHILVALSGPLLSGIVAILLHFISTLISWPSVLLFLINCLIIVNCLLAVINVLPFYPLDMGIVFRFTVFKLNSKNEKVVFPIGILFIYSMFLTGLYLICTGYFNSGIWYILGSISFRSALRVSNEKQYLLTEMRGEKVGDYMRTNPITVHPSLSLDKFMTEYYYRYHESIYPVVQYSSVQGVVTKQNIRKIPRTMWKNYNVREIADSLSADNATTKDTDIVEILKKLTDRSDHNLLVVNGEELEGVLTLEDLLPYFSLKVCFSPQKSARYYLRKENFSKEGKSKPERVYFFPDKS